ncbi:MAG: M28 family peptidase [bacterium]
MNFCSFISRVFLPFLISFLPQINIAQSFSIADSAVEKRLRRDIGILASDSFRGREAGTIGEKRAYEYIISQFREAGLVPGGTEPGSFLQPFQKTWVGFSGKTMFRIGKQEIIYTQQFSVTSLSGNGEAHGQVADCGQGIVIGQKLRDDYRTAGDIRGKLVLIDLDIPREWFRDTSLSRYLAPRFRMKQALDRGAAGVIFWHRHSVYQSSIFNFQVTDTLPAPAIYVNAEIAELLKQNTTDTADICIKVFRKQVTYYNVLGRIDNGAPSTIIFGAHYDHNGINRDSAVINGADDNASGTAGILEMARYYIGHRDSSYNYLFAAFSAEEKGLLGSAWFCNHPVIPLDSVAFMVNFDMIGRLGWNENVVTAEATKSSPLWKKLYHEVPHPSFRIKKIPGSLPFSDHYYFYLKGKPILYLNTGLHPQYHTQADDTELINLSGMSEILKYSRALITWTARYDKIPYRKVSGFDNLMSYLGFAFEILGKYIGY